MSSSSSSSSASTTNGKKVSDYLEDIKQAAYETKDSALHYKELDTPSFIIILGIAISGLAAAVYTYEAITNISEEYVNCANSDSLKTKLNWEFGILLTCSILAIILAIVMFIFLRKSRGGHRILVLSVLTLGIFGTVYSLSIPFQSAVNSAKLFLSWGLLLFFIGCGFFMSYIHRKNSKSDITYGSDLVSEPVTTYGPSSGDYN